MKYLLSTELSRLLYGWVMNNALQKYRSHLVFTLHDGRHLLAFGQQQMIELVNNTKENIKDFYPMHSSNPESIYSIESMSEKVQHLNSKLNCFICYMYMHYKATIKKIPIKQLTSQLSNLNYLQKLISKFKRQEAKIKHCLKPISLKFMHFDIQHN